MPGGSRSAVGPVTDKRLAELIEPVVAAVGMDLESVRTSVAGKRRLLRIVVDGDHGVSLDDAADVSREISAMLDEANALGEVPYTLEVSSPGVDRPLTEPRHWRRAVGRLVKVKVAGEPALEGRILAADADGVTLDLAKGERRFQLGELGAGAIQIEFGRITDAELDQAEDEDDDPDLADEDDGGQDDEDDEDLGAGGDGH
jgi:ribosome maturation factor RimP